MNGYRITLRRCYYELVARNLIANSEDSYKKLGSALVSARKLGLMDPLAFLDLGRQPYVPETWATPREAVVAAAANYRSDWWDGGVLLVEVWAEKDAAIGILQPEADRMGVTAQSCRGHASITMLAEAVERWEGRHAIVLYFGDHDPTGLHIPQKVQEEFERMGADADLHRMALNPDQIQEHQLPPQPTKMTDSRARGYGHEGSWELDALPAPILAQIARDAISDMGARRPGRAPATGPQGPAGHDGTGGAAMSGEDTCDGCMDDGLPVSDIHCGCDLCVQLLYAGECTADFCGCEGQMKYLSIIQAAQQARAGRHSCPAGRGRGRRPRGL